MDPVGDKLAAFLKGKRNEILDLVERAERCAQALQENPPAQVLCHSDLHAGNILIDGNDALYIVDWDDPIYAPKERDLMFPGGGQGFRGHTASQEEALFYQGYGQDQDRSNRPGLLPLRTDHPGYRRFLRPGLFIR